MRTFGVPFNINKEDKFIGGVLSIRQALWLAIPIFVIIMLFVADRSYIIKNASGGISINALKIVFKLFTSFFVTIITIFLAFASMDGTKADTYTFKLFKFKMRKRTIKYNDKI